MNYSALIQNRKSVRAFTDKEVPLSVLQEIRSWFASSSRPLIPELKTELHF